MNKPTRTRWKIAGLLCMVATVNYFQRVNISVAADPMMKVFQLTQTQMGSVFSAFLVGYMFFQIPGGMLADRFGPRRVLGWATLSWGLFTVLTGMISTLAAMTGASVLVALVALRFVFGISTGMFPMCLSSGSICIWCKSDILASQRVPGSRLSPGSWQRSPPLGGGWLSDRLIATRLGLDWGRRIVPMACQIGAALFLCLGARVENGYAAAGVLAVCTGLIMVSRVRTGRPEIKSPRRMWDLSVVY
jgi:hypothetical protein